MPKRVDNIFLPKLKFKNMLEAYERASKNKHYNKEVVIYELDLASNIIKTLKQLYDGTYRTSKYNSFTIYEPKKRIIKSLPFFDRVVQQWYVEEFVKPIFVPKFIEDSYACLEKKGVHQAVKKLQKYAYNKYNKNKEFYFLKCDIKKFFNSIDKKILYEIISRYVKDKRFLNYTNLLIFEAEEEIGIPIGNYTSQYFANIYLNTLDHYIKEDLKIKYYVRYMDDFVLILDTKEECREALEKIGSFLKNKLKLNLNQKTNYFKNKQGVIFCGYKVFPKYILLKKQNKKKIYKKVKYWNKLYSENKLDLKDTYARLSSWKGHAQCADTHRLIKQIEEKCNWLYKE